MGGVLEKSVGSARVFYEATAQHRWYDAIGGTVVKVVEDFQYPVLTSADTPVGWTVTLVEGGAGETTLAAVGGANGGELLITTDAAENDGANLQVQGECFSFASKWDCYFGVRYKTGEATQSDILFGLCITDTDLLGGMTDGIYFRKVDGATGVSFVLEKNSVETEVPGVLTQDADTYHWLEFTYDGTDVKAYVDGTNVATIAGTNANFCNDEFLTPSIHFLTGNAAAETLTIDKIVAIQVQG